MATSNTMNFGPEWMRRFPKTPTSDSNRLTSPTLLPSNVSTNASAISGSANNNTSTSFNTNGTNGSSTHTFSWSSVAAANSNSNTTSRSLHNEVSEKSDVPGADSALNPFKYSKEFMLKLYKPVGLPLEFERHEYVTSEEPLQPMALIMLTEQEHKLLSGASVNSELTRRIVSNATGGVVTGNERVVERERVPFSPRGDKHIGTGLTSPRTERFVGITGGVLSERTSPRSSRPPRVSGTLNTSSVDDPVWNGVTRHAIGTFDSNGVFRIPGSNVEDEPIDKSKKDDSERKKIEQELEKKSQTSLSDTVTYNQSSQGEMLTLKKEQTEFQDESINEIEESLKSISIKESQSPSQENPLDHQKAIPEQQSLQEQSDGNGWQESHGQETQQDENSEQQNVREIFHQQEQNEQSSSILSQRHNESEKQQNPQDNRNLVLEEEKEREKDRERENERDRERDQQLVEQQVLMQLQQEKEKELQQRHEKQKMQRQFQEQEQQLQIQMQQRQEQEQKQLQLQLQLQLQHQQHQQQQHQQQQQQLLLQQQQQHILQDQDLLQRQQHILQHHHQQLLLPHHFDPDQDDDVLKEAFSYSGVVGNTPPMSPTGKSNKYSNAHSIIGTTSSFGDTSGAASLFSSGGITPDARKISSEQKWLYRDPSGNIQGPFSSQEMNDWYKGGFFVLSLLVKRVEDTTFEPLGVLIRKTGDDERPFSAPLMGSRPSLTIAMPNNSSRVVNDPFPRTWAAPTSPSTAQLFLEHQQRFNPFGGTTSVPSTPFDRYQFGGVFGRNDVTNGWNDLGTNNNAWGSTSNAGNLSPRLPAPNSPPLFNSTSSFNVSPPQTYLEHQRVLTSQIERQQFLMLQQRQIQQNQHTYPETFLRQQHQNFANMPGPVSAPITNAPNSPFVDVLSRSSGWTTTTTDQPPPASPWGIIAPGIGVTPSRVSQSEDIGYFGMRKENNLGLQQSRTGERPYDVMGGQIHETSFDSKVLDGVSESVAKPVLGEEDAYNKKVEENLINQEKTDTPQSSKSPPQLTQKEELIRSKSSLREIQAEEERKKQYGEKEKSSVITSTSTNSNTIGKLPQFQKPSNLGWGNNSPVTPSSPAPWAKDEDHSVQKNMSLREIQEIEAKQAVERQVVERQAPERKSSTISATLAPWAKDEDHSAQKTPSLREIQEMEAKQAAERQASERKAASTSTINTAPNKEDAIPSSISWGIVVPTPSNESNSSSLSTSPVVATPAWQSNNTAPKKTLREIQKEEEEATKRRNKIREMQQAALNNASASSSTTTQSGVGKRYADTVSIVTAKKTPTNNVNNAWTTVASKTVTRATANSSTTNGTPSGTTKSSTASKDSSIVWDNDHKSNNSLQGSSRVQNQTNKPGETLKNGARTAGVSLGTSKPATTNSIVKPSSQSSGNATSFSEYSTPKPPSEEFLKWCKQALRGLNNVNVEEFMQMLLSFPLDPPPATVEIIQDSIYANSPTLDGRRFADEFIKRRKADANGLPMNSSLSHVDNKINKDSATGNNSSKEDYAGNGAGAFKVVTAKKSKKKQTN